MQGIAEAELAKKEDKLDNGKEETIDPTLLVQEIKMKWNYKNIFSQQKIG